MRFSCNRSSFAVILLGLLVVAPAGFAKDKMVKVAPKEPQDEIEVVGHIPLTDGPIRRFFVTQHYSSNYVYAERDPGKSVTLIDISRLRHPSVLAELSSSPNGGSGSLFAVSGTAALVSSETSAATSAAPQTIRIMDFSDVRNPKVAREFTGVTAISRDQPGLILVANSEGAWILQQRFAEDPEVEKAYAHQVVYQ